MDYGDGLITDFNSLRSHTYPAAWLLLEDDDDDITTSAPSVKFNVALVIAKKDKMDSLDYEDIVDECHEIASKLIYQYRNVINGYKKVTMDGVKREKFVKRYADCITGVTLSFSLNSPDQSNVC
jgi:hypothetical protein